MAVFPTMLLHRILHLAALAAPLAVAAQDSTGSRTLVPLPAVYYAPETGLAFGAVLGLFDTPPRRPDGTTLPTSSLLAVAIFTTKAQLITSIKAELWPSGGNRHVVASADVQRFPTLYWGIGNDTPDSAEEDYTQLFTAGYLEWTRRVWRRLYLGGAARFRWRDLTETTSGGLLEDPATPGIATGLVAGAGTLASWDTRDKVSGPHRGALLQFRADAYSDTPGSGGPFGLIQTDLRAYIPLLPQHTLAVQAWLRGAWGDAPFDHLASLGGDAILRGYFEGRFRDNMAVAFQAEYRGFFVGPIGLAFGGGVGRVAPSLGDLAASGWHGTVGGGLRVLIDRSAGLAIRVDWATATDGSASGLYFNAAEAF